MSEKEQLIEGGELWNFIHSSRNTFWTDGHLGMARRAQEILDKFTIQQSANPVFCEHANEVPARCPCEQGCYCKTHTCRAAPPRSDRPNPAETPKVLDCTREYGHSGPCNGWPCSYVRKKLDFGQKYGVSNAKVSELREITDKEAAEKLKAMFEGKAPRKNLKYTLIQKFLLWPVWDRLFEGKTTDTHER